MFELVDNSPQHAVIKVIGVGGGGGNAVQHMVDKQIDGVDFICANTDAQALQRMNSGTLLQLGNDVTKGLGAGANPERGKQAAIEDKELLRESLEGADMVFITAGMGGGTGTGAAPIVAQIARELGILTVAVVTKPFPFEGKKRMNIAEQGIAELSEYVDSLITVPNQKLLRQDMQDFLISWDRDRLGSINYAIDIGLKNLSVADRDDPVRAHTSNVAASNPCVDRLNLTARH